MSRPCLRWRCRRHHSQLGLAPRGGAFRASPDGEAEHCPSPDGPKPAAPPPLAAPQQKLTLYASGAIVVLIVLVIIALGSRAPRRALAYMPVGQSAVQVVDMRRFARGPVHRILSSADHRIAKKLEKLEEDWNISPRRDIDLVADGDDITVLIGRFGPKRLRKAFEDAIEERETRLTRPGKPPVRLKLVERHVDNHRYLLCLRVGAGEAVDQEANIIAFAAVRSSLICIGRRGLGVRRFLRTYAGLRDPVLKDPHFAAAYSPRLARKAFLRRLEKPGGVILKGQLGSLLGDDAVGLRAAFFALTSSAEAIGITVRLAADGEQAAQRLEARLSTPESLTALAEAIGPGAELAVSRSAAAVVLEAEIDLATFEVIVLNDKKADAEPKGKKPRPKNLILALLAA